MPRARIRNATVIVMVNNAYRIHVTCDTGKSAVDPSPASKSWTATQYPWHVAAPDTQCPALTQQLSDEAPTFCILSIRSQPHQ